MFLFILEKGKKNKKKKKRGQWAAQLGQINRRQIKSVTEVRKKKIQIYTACTSRGT